MPQETAQKEVKAKAKEGEVVETDQFPNLGATDTFFFWG